MFAACVMGREGSWSDKHVLHDPTNCIAAVSLQSGKWSFTVVHHLSCQAKLSTSCAVSDLFAQSNTIGLVSNHDHDAQDKCIYKDNGNDSSASSINKHCSHSNVVQQSH